MRTLYVGFTFEVIRESEAFNSGSFTVSGGSGAVIPSAPSNSGKLTRHRLVTEGHSTWIPDGDKYPVTAATPHRYTGPNVTLYANGEAVAVNRYSTYDYTGGVAYLGKDVLGSVRGVSNEWGRLEERYEYDAFGKPYKGDFTNGVGLGYTGKPYDTVTGMYNYGYRDYAPEMARFTIIPIMNRQKTGMAKRCKIQTNQEVADGPHGMAMSGYRQLIKVRMPLIGM